MIKTIIVLHKVTLTNWLKFVKIPSLCLFPNYKLIVFQLLTVTPQEPMLCHEFLPTFLPDPPRPLFPPPDVLPGGAAPSCHNTPYINLSPHRIIHPPGHQLSLSQHTDATRLAPILLCPCFPPPTLPRSCQSCCIPVTAIPLPLP